MGCRGCLVFCAGLFVFLAVWNITKLPSYLAASDTLPYKSTTFNETECNTTSDQPNFITVPYKCHGMEASINVAKLVANFRSGKIISDPVNFLSFHVVTGASTLILLGLGVFFPDRRVQYAWPTCISAIVLGIHTTPATFAVNELWKTILFCFTSTTVAAFGILGIVVLLNWDRLMPNSYNYLSICYGVMAFGACGAGYAEFLQLIIMIVKRVSWGFWPQSNMGDLPAPLSGHAFYDHDEWHWIFYYLITVWIVVWFGGGITYEYLCSQGALDRDVFLRLFGFGGALNKDDVKNREGARLLMAE